MPKQQLEFNLKKLDGVFGYSVVSGFMLSILIFTGIDVSETGILVNVLQAVAEALDSSFSYLVLIISILVTVGEIAVIAINIKRISEHGYAGAIVSVTGFFGTLLIFVGAMENIQITYIGIAVCAVGVIVARLGDG